MTIETRAYARAGLLGNPSDGYCGRTISISVRNFAARITLQESAELVIEPHPADCNVFRNLEHLRSSVGTEGYYGGARLVKAAVKRFTDWCADAGIILPERNFTLSYATTIPRQVGLAGSSAIITATMRALMQFHEVAIPSEVLPTLIMKAETEELGISAGLQDRVIQVLEGCVYMDFARVYLEEHGFGRYEALDPALLPPLWLAWRQDYRKVSGRLLDGMRMRFEAGDPVVVGTLGEIADLAREGRDALMSGDRERLKELMNRNFDLRRRIMPIDDGDLLLIERARALGASAKLTGSGGAVIGICDSDDIFSRLAAELQQLGAGVIVPEVVSRPAG